jgi:type IV pilus assembly protein PilM
MGKGVWGIDVSKYSIKAVRMESSGTGTCSITATDVAPYSEEGTGEAANLDEQIRTTLEEMKSRLRIGSERVVLSLPGHSTFNRLIKLPPVDDTKIADVVKYEAQSQIPFNIDEVIWDYQFVERQYGPGEEKEVILFAIKKDIVEQFLKNIEHLGLNVDSIQFAPVALYNFLVKDQDVGSSAVALDMGGDNTDLIIIDGPKFWIRNLPITGNDITKALQKSFNIPFGEAEKLKLKAGQSQQAQKIFNAIQPVLRDLVGEVHRSIGYYKSISKSIRFDKVILLGNSTKTLNFSKFVSQSLQMPANHIGKLNHITVAGSVDQAAFNEDIGTLGTAIGLALQGHGEGKNKVNLLPPVFLKKKELKKKQPFIVGIAVALYLLVGAIWYTWNQEVSALTTSVGLATSTANAARAQTAAYDEAKKLEGYEGPLRRLSSISYERDLCLKIMNLVTPNIPENGKRDASGDAQKLWILDWKFEEIAPKPSDAAASAAPGAAVQQGASRGYVTDKLLRVKIEGAVFTGGRKSSDIANAVAQKLLGVDGQGKKIVSVKCCVVDEFALVRNPTDGLGMTWGVSCPEETAHLVPTDVNVPVETVGGRTEEPEKLYTRFEITLELPLNPAVRADIKKKRKDAEDAAKAGAAPGTPKK